MFKVGDIVKYRLNYITSNKAWYCYDHYLITTYRVVNKIHSELTLECKKCKKVIFASTGHVLPHDWVIIRLRATNQ